MKKRKRLIEQLYDEKAIIVLIAAIFVLLSVYLCIVTQVPVRGLSYYKQLSLQIHEQMQAIVNDAELSTPGLDYIDPNNLEEVLALYAYYSMLSDLKWLEEKENNYFEQMQKADTKEEEQILIKKEIACGVIVQYVLLLNVAATEDTSDYNEARLNMLVGEAQFRINSVKSPYLSKEILEDIASNSGLKINEVEEEIGNLMEEYIELRKQALQEAIKSGDKKKQYIEAKKMLMLAGSFQ